MTLGDWLLVIACLLGIGTGILICTIVGDPSALNRTYQQMGKY